MGMMQQQPQVVHVHHQQPVYGGYGYGGGSAGIGMGGGLMGGMMLGAMMHGKKLHSLISGVAVPTLPPGLRRPAVACWLLGCHVRSAVSAEA